MGIPKVEGGKTVVREKTTDKTKVTDSPSASSTSENNVNTTNTSNIDMSGALSGSGNSNSSTGPINITIVNEPPAYDPMKILEQLLGPQTPEAIKENLRPGGEEPKAKEPDGRIIDGAEPSEENKEGSFTAAKSYIPKEIVDHAFKFNSVSDPSSMSDYLNPNRKTLDNVADDVRKDVKLNTPNGKFIKETFGMLDKNGDGKILYSELQEAYQNTADVIHNKYPEKSTLRGEPVTPQDMTEKIAKEVNDDIMQYAKVQNGADNDREINLTEWGVYLERNHIYKNDFLKPIEEL